jgi:hypothetical protein
VGRQLRQTGFQVRIVDGKAIEGFLGELQQLTILHGPDGRRARLAGEQRNFAETVAPGQLRQHLLGTVRMVQKDLETYQDKLDQLLGTPLEPDLTDHVLMIEEVSEALYRVDRMMFHLTSQPSMRKLAGIRLGSVSDVVQNDPDFGLTAEEIVRYWCQRSGIPYLGRARVGHDADNHVVPFGRR